MQCSSSFWPRTSSHFPRAFHPPPGSTVPWPSTDLKPSATDVSITRQFFGPSMRQSSSSFLRQTAWPAWSDLDPLQHSNISSCSVAAGPTHNIDFHWHRCHQGLPYPIAALPATVPILRPFRRSGSATPYPWRFASRPSPIASLSLRQYLLDCCFGGIQSARWFSW